MAMRAVRGEKAPLSDENLVFVGNTPLKQQETAVSGTYVEIDGEPFYQIGHYDQMRPFFMSLVSGSDHWLFISSNGGLTAGRTNANSALFPYETEDKLTANRENTGSKTILRVTRHGRTHLWEPFSARYAHIYHCERHLYKNITGNKLIFEEINHDLQLTFRYAWRTGERFGFIKSSWLHNNAEEACQIVLLDGLQNLLPYGATVALQTSMSNLLHAYKRSELEPQTGLGIYALSATLTDQAEPSESLKATVAWQVGLENVTHLLSAEQVEAFRHGLAIAPETDVRGKAGAYLVQSEFTLTAGDKHTWHIVAEVNQDSAAVVALTRFLRQQPDELIAALEADIAENTAALVSYVAAADGVQTTAAETTAAHHFANVMFNVMRGGIFANGYCVAKSDLLDFVQIRNRPLLAKYADWFADLPEQIEIQALYKRAETADSPDLMRVCYEYLPLTFSRRHGDPSRPWNQFSINLKHADGSPRLDYQGNWRDIFQNWEPLLLSFPAYTAGVIAKFLNATTADGYNPYRVTREGIEWEVVELDNPWANIGYWSDHQIIYLQKLLELAAQLHPGELQTLWQRPIFAYANVPYRIRPYQEMLADWYSTIEFDHAQDKALAELVEQMGTDAKLHLEKDGSVKHVTMIEKLLVLLLAKLTNLVPEGGIWMNTQRPEWNDANNALVGKGLSVVTAAYLRRFVAFWNAQLAASEEAFTVNTAVAELLTAVQAVFAKHEASLQSGFDNQTRRAVMDALGTAVTDYRATIYDEGLPQTTAALNSATLRGFLALAQRYLEQTLQANRRADDLYHSYNILQLGEGTAAVGHLYLMLEGQVAILSSGMLSAAEALALLKQMRQSELYRADQHSYMLYPNRRLPLFQEKNSVPAAKVAGSALVKQLVEHNDGRLLTQDIAGDFHFNGTFRNDRDAARVLDELAQEPAFAEPATAEREAILTLFEETFHHSAFTGRSGTFFAYEGLGSIYWHMVSKLLLAVQECYFAAVQHGAAEATTAALADAYYDVRAGIGFNKTPDVYGAFPTDPYSHTPFGGGASQPGMTGQVKEEILTRLGEFGVSIQDGRISFEPQLLRDNEFLTSDGVFDYIDKAGRPQSLPLSAGSLAFTLCQTPIVYHRGDQPSLELSYTDGETVTVAGQMLDGRLSQQVFDRDLQLQMIRVTTAGNYEV